jgi:hypothetical protein
MNPFYDILAEFDCPDINFDRSPSEEEDASVQEAPPLAKGPVDERLIALEASHRRLEEALQEAQRLISCLVQRSETPAAQNVCESCKSGWRDEVHFSSREHVAKVHFSRFCPGDCSASSTSVQKRNAPVVRFNAAKHLRSGKTVVCRSCGWRANVQ